MSLLTALSLLDIVVFGLSLAVFAYFFYRFAGRDDTSQTALIMREINTVKPAPQPAKAKAKVAGAA
jgi:hypothetical protein